MDAFFKLAAESEGVFAAERLAPVLRSTCLLSESAGNSFSMSCQRKQETCIVWLVDRDTMVHTTHTSVVQYQERACEPEQRDWCKFGKFGLSCSIVIKR